MPKGESPRIVLRPGCVGNYDLSLPENRVRSHRCQGRVLITRIVLDEMNLAELVLLLGELGVEATRSCHGYPSDYYLLTGVLHNDFDQDKVAIVFSDLELLYL